MNTIVAMNRLPTPSQIVGFDRELRTRAHLRDIYVNQPGLYTRTGQPVPNAIYTDIAEANKGSVQTTVTMMLDQTADPILGEDRVGNEEAPVTKNATVYRNNWSHAIREDTYGARHLEQIDYGLYDKHKKGLALYAQQYEGLMIRQAGLQVRAENLWVGDTATQCPAGWNPNIFVQGASDADQPQYDPDLSTYSNRIVHGMMAGTGSLTPTNAQAMTYRMMNKLANWALDRKIMPLDIGGNDAFILTISELNAAIFSDPTFASNTGGAVWTAVAQLSEKIQNWYNVLGCFKSAAGVDIYIVVDHKSPTLIPGGTSEPYTLSAGYIRMGDIDLRQRSNPLTRDAGMLWGKSGVVKWEPEKLHYIKQDDNYFKQMGQGIAAVVGIQLLCWNPEDPADRSLEHQGSAVVVLARISY